MSSGMTVDGESGRGRVNGERVKIFNLALYSVSGGEAKKHQNEV